MGRGAPSADPHDEGQRRFVEFLAALEAERTEKEALRAEVAALTSRVDELLDLGQTLMCALQEAVARGLHGPTFLDIVSRAVDAIGQARTEHAGARGRARSRRRG